MRFSEALIPTLKEDPAEAEVVSHRLMMRAGMIRKLAAGIYDLLPLGLRVIRKVENIVRQEMNAAGCQEVFLPSVQPAELWQESGRWDQYGPELLRLRDRHNREFCYGPTAEEVITELVRGTVRSYRQLPLNLYQIQTKFRDEIRPRFGLMRCREFGMKDAYSFDADEPGAEASYRVMYDTYSRIFARCGLRFRAVEADTGAIGGSFSHEFMVLANTGEDAIAACESCQYAANIEKAEIGLRDEPEPFTGEADAPERVPTPGRRTIEEVTSFLDVKPDRLIKTLILTTPEGTVAALVRGDHDLAAAKLKLFLGVEWVEMADPETIQRITGAPVGFAGPVGMAEKIRIVADNVLRGIGPAVVGGNETDVHIANVLLGRDFTPDDFADIREAQKGDACPRCEGNMTVMRGIEVGHVFKLGTKYSKAMGATFLDENGHELPLVMGCYGIGIGRTAAAAIEQNHDDKGIIWPVPLAPYEVLLLSINPGDSKISEASDRLMAELEGLGIEVLYDDRDERPGVKFNDADLLGIPFRITVGARNLEQGLVEIKRRNETELKKVPIDQVVKMVADMVTEAKAV